jgi:hypothetical protein
MTLTAHTSIGCAIGLALGNPVAGFFVGWASHHILDSIPHSDLGSVGANIKNVLEDDKQMLWIYADIIAAAIIFFAFLFNSSLKTAILWGTIGAILPDFVDNSPFWSAYTRKVFPTNLLHKLHEKLHFTIHLKKYFVWGLVTQAVVIVASLAYLVIKLA